MNFWYAVVVLAVIVATVIVTRKLTPKPEPEPKVFGLDQATTASRVIWNSGVESSMKTVMAKTTIAVFAALGFQNTVKPEAEEQRKLLAAANSALKGLNAEDLNT